MPSELTTTVQHPFNAVCDRPSVRVLGERIHLLAPLPEHGVLVIGRADDAQLQVCDRSVSRHHAALEIGTGAVHVRDLGSTNGTFVGARRLLADEVVALHGTEMVSVGNLLVALQGLGELGLPTAPPAARNAGTMAEVARLIERVANTAITVLLLGETGVGKDVTAGRLHAASHRRAAPLLRLNCAALSETLLESELFGHEKGAFTGAMQTKPGLLESAEGGSVFLDEIGELSLNLQAKLLRVLEDRSVMRVGAIRSRAIDVRFIAATNRDLWAEVEAGRFRRDLYYRLNGIAIAIPPLRERLDELHALAEQFSREVASQLGRPAPQFSPEARAVMRLHTWPGNIRELRNVIQRAVLLSAAVIAPDNLIFDGNSPVAQAAISTDDDSLVAETLATTVKTAERQRIISALAACTGSQTRAARLLGVSRSTLVARLDEFGLPRPRKPGKAS